MEEKNHKKIQGQCERLTVCLSVRPSRPSVPPLRLINSEWTTKQKSILGAYIITLLTPWIPWIVNRIFAMTTKVLILGVLPACVVSIFKTPYKVFLDQHIKEVMFFSEGRYHTYDGFNCCPMQINHDCACSPVGGLYLHQKHFLLPACLPAYLYGSRANGAERTIPFTAS